MMHRQPFRAFFSRARLRAAASLILWSGLIAGAQPAPAATLQGTAFYRERMALPAAAVFEAVLQEASGPAAAPKVLGRTVIKSAGQPPFHFAIEYDPGTVRPDGRYEVRATVTLQGRTLFETRPPRPVLHGAPAPLNLLLVSARGAGRPAPFAELPASYERDVPGADSLVRWHLDLLPAGQYQLRTTYVDKPSVPPADRIGRWRLHPGRSAVEIFQPGQASLFFSVKEEGALLQPADARGAPVESDRNAPLRRLPAFAPVEPNLRLAGMFSYMADAASVTLCEDNRRLPVAMEGDYKALEKAYLEARPQPGHALYASIEGRIVQRPSAEESRPPRATVVVDRFLAIDADNSCGRAATALPLRGVEWKLVELEGQALAAADKARAPNLTFSATDERVSGSGGCNRLSGRYTLDGDKLSFGPLAGTMMACIAGMDQEKRFLQALAKVRSHRVAGGYLELLDGAGAVIARFAPNAAAPPPAVDRS